MEYDWWEREYQKVPVPAIPPVLTGFNVNLDRVMTVSHTFLDALDPLGEPFFAFRSRLLSSMERCTAAEWIVNDPAMYHSLVDHYTSCGPLSLGGQAGIAALHLRSLGAPQIICLAPSIGKTTGRLLKDGGVTVPDDCAGTDCIHLIFEYAPGVVPLAHGAIPRNNRFIVSPKKTARDVLLPDPALNAIVAQHPECTRAFLSGFQYLEGDDEFKHAAGQIASLRSADRAMRIHIECVSVDDRSVNDGIVRHILPAADSAGMNEHELSLLLGRPIGHDPVSLVRGMLELIDRTGICRVHLHTYGYYLLVAQRDCCGLEQSRAALMFAAQNAARTAAGTTTALSQEGVLAIAQLPEHFAPGSEPGTFESGDCHILGVPTLIAAGIARTVGLGDIISSTAFAADPFKPPKSA